MVEATDRPRIPHRRTDEETDYELAAVLIDTLTIRKMLCDTASDIRLVREQGRPWRVEIRVPLIPMEGVADGPEKI